MKMKKIRATKENMLKLFQERLRVYRSRWLALCESNPHEADKAFAEVMSMEVVIACMTDTKDFNDYWRIFFPDE